MIDCWTALGESPLVQTDAENLGQRNNNIVFSLVHKQLYCMEFSAVNSAFTISISVVMHSLVIPWRFFLIPFLMLEVSASSGGQFLFFVIFF